MSRFGQMEWGDATDRERELMHEIDNADERVVAAEDKALQAEQECAILRQQIGMLKSGPVGQTVSVEGTDEPCLTLEAFDKMVDHQRSEKMPIGVKPYTGPEIDLIFTLRGDAPRYHVGGEDE